MKRLLLGVLLFFTSGAAFAQILGSNVTAGTAADHPGNTVLIAGYYTSPCTCTNLTQVNVYSGGLGSSNYVLMLYPTSGGVADGQHPIGYAVMTHTDPVGWDIGTISGASLTSGATYALGISGDANWQGWRAAGGSMAYATGVTYTGSAIDPAPTLNPASFTYAMYLSQPSAATPTISPSTANPLRVSTGQAVTMACATSGSSIYYTSGSTVPADPTTSSTLYTGAITVTGSAEYFKALCVKSGLADSTITEQGYLIGNLTLYVRSDGGTRYDPATRTSGQCNGYTNAAYPGSGTNRDCAFNDVRWLWDDQTNLGYNHWALIGGDTAIIATKSGGWQVGFDSPTTSPWCNGAFGAHYCGMSPPPSGTPSNPTRFLGANYAACSHTVAENTGVAGRTYYLNQPDPAKTTELYGDYSLDTMVSLQGSHDVQFECLEFDTHNSTHCITHGQTIAGGQPPETPACSTSPPYDHNAYRAFYSDYTDYNILLQDVNIHGFSSEGMRGEFGGPAVSTGTPSFTFNRVRQGFNNGPGWNMSSLSGHHDNGPNSWLDAHNYLIEFSGFVEEYPIVDPTPAIVGFSQSTGSNDADGISSQALAQFDFTCDHCVSQYGTEDAWDLGHIEYPDAHVLSLTNSLDIGNMGGSYKWGKGATNITLTDNFLVNNCYRMHAAMAGAPSTYNKYLVDWCRGANFISGYSQATSSYLFQHNQMFSAIDTGFDIECDAADCTGMSMVLKNNVLVGISDQNCIADSIGTCDYGGNGKPGALFTVGAITITHTYNDWYNFRGLTLGTGEVLADPQTVALIPYDTFIDEPSLDSFDFSLQTSSPAKYAGLASSVTSDFFGDAFHAPPSMGGVEFNTGTPTAAAPTYSPNGATSSSPIPFTLSTTSPGAIICQSNSVTPATNGSTGCTTGSLYTGTITASSTGTWHAVAGGSGYVDSTVSSATFTVNPQASTPVWTPSSPHTDTAAFSASIAESTGGAIVCWKLGSAPVIAGASSCPAGSTLYSGLFTISASGTYHAVAGGPGLTDSADAPAAYTITPPMSGPHSMDGNISISGGGGTTIFQ